MAGRPIWRGHLRLALVSCPVALYTAHQERGNLHFHLINPETGNRVRMVTVDAETDHELQRRDLVRGYEFRKDNYLVLSDEDFESVRIESTSTLNVEKFVAADAIDPLYFDTAYYMVPDGDAGLDVYVVLREAIARSGRLALSRVVIGRRERTVAIRPLDHGLVAHTLHETRDINDPKEAFTAVPGLKPDPEMVRLAIQLVDRQTAPFAPAADLEDRYEARLRELIEAKLRGEGQAPAPEDEPDRGNVVDLMQALKQSLGSDRAKAAGKPAPKPKAPPRKTATRSARKRA
jgi:DNA end-binding protein Ku